MTNEPHERSSTSEDGISDDGISRRSLVKKIGAAGVIAWTAPVIMESKVAAQAAGTDIIEANTCYKYQYNWWLFADTEGANVPDNGAVATLTHNLMRQFDVQTPSYPAFWHEECQASDNDGVHLAGRTTALQTGGGAVSASERYKSNAISVNGQCCKHGGFPNEVPPVPAQPWDWWQSDETTFAERIDTFPIPECVTISPTCGSAGTGQGFLSNEITFTLPATGPCSSCYFTDPSLVYVTETPATSFSNSSTGGRRSKQVTIEFGTNRRWPVYLKTWIACGEFATVPSCTTEAEIVLTVT